jgi:hypothetical protein
MHSTWRWENDLKQVHPRNAFPEIVALAMPRAKSASKGQKQRFRRVFILSIMSILSKSLLLKV